MGRAWAACDTDVAWELNISPLGVHPPPPRHFPWARPYYHLTPQLTNDISSGLRSRLGLRIGLTSFFYIFLVSRGMSYKDNVQEGFLTSERRRGWVPLYMWRNTYRETYCRWTRRFDFPTCSFRRSAAARDWASAWTTHRTSQHLVMAYQKKGQHNEDRLTFTGPVEWAIM